MVMALAALGVGLALVLAPGLLAGRADAQRQAAEALWAARPFRHYRLVVEELRPTTRTRCTQDAEVRDEQVVQVFADTCGGEGRTVGSLFTEVARGSYDAIYCVPGGCECGHGRMRVRASYDEALGYPQALHFQLAWADNWGHPDYWRHLWQHWQRPPCEVTPDLRAISVRSLTPLP
jgi:hypothetical protein